MSFRPSGRDDSDMRAALGIGYVQQQAFAHPEQVDAFFAIVLAVVNCLDGQWIAKGLDRLIERNIVTTPIVRSLCIVPNKIANSAYKVLIISS
jgi:hypothetical protein